MKTLDSFPPGTLLTVSGKEFNLLNPDMSLVLIEDIAHGLSYTCRWNGHTRTYYSVAEHSIGVMERYEAYARPRGVYTKKGSLAALLHDAEEAYWGDIPSPIKALYPEIEEKLSYLRIKIMDKFGAEYIANIEAIEICDKKMLQWEYDNLMNKSKVATEHPFLIKQRFLFIYDSLTS